MRSITLSGFDAAFREDGDPWRTFSNRDEAVKRRAVLRALGTRPLGAMLELGAGNGSNSVALARRVLRLDATDGAREAVRLIADAIADRPSARAIHLALPARAPRPHYDAVVVAELLYYLSPTAMGQVAREVARLLPRGGRLVLAHHRIQFHDFAQHAGGIHPRFLRETRVDWRVREVDRTSRWSVIACVRLDAVNPARPVQKRH